MMQQKRALQLQVPKTTVHQLLHMKEGGLNPHSAGLKEENKYAWLTYALDMIDPTNASQFCDMKDFMHMDEKWFYLTCD